MRRFIVQITFLVVVAACGGSDDAGIFTDTTDSSADTAAVTTAATVPEADTTVPEADTTSVVAETTTTTTTTTTTAPEEPEPATAEELLEELSSRCEAGDFVMCDILFQASDFGSVLEAFGDTCGGRVESSGDYCADQFGVPYDLDQLRTGCGEGDMAACDQLYLYSPFDSLDEAFGDECGGIGEGDNLTCVVSWGFTVDRG